MAQKEACNINATDKWGRNVSKTQGGKPTQKEKKKPKTQNQAKKP